MSGLRRFLGKYYTFKWIVFLCLLTYLIPTAFLLAKHNESYRSPSARLFNILEPLWFASRNYSPEKNCAEKSPTGSADINSWELYQQIHNLAMSPDAKWLPVHNQSIRVFIVPHSHVDPGWLKTFDQYYTDSVRKIISNVVAKLHQLPDMRFIWSEMSFLERWVREAGEAERGKLRDIVRRGQLEICGGAWVMPDEATTHFWASLDNIVEGQRWVNGSLGVVPAAWWSVDPFGHGLAAPILTQLARIRRLVIGRVHTHIKRRLRRESELVFRWRQPWEASGGALTSVLPNVVYLTWDGCGPDRMVCCRYEWGPSADKRCRHPPVTDASVEKLGSTLADQYRRLASLHPSRVLLVTLGTDFAFQSPEDFQLDHDNYQRLFRYFRQRQPDIQASFGTVSEYFAELERRTEASPPPSLTGDFFPYTDNFPSAQWTGYYSTRAHWKALERSVASLLRSVYLLVSLHTNKTLREAAASELGPASRDVALFQHHDGLTGTSTAEVMADYERRLLAAWDGAAAVAQRLAASHAGAEGFALLSVREIRRPFGGGWTISELAVNSPPNPRIPGGDPFLGSLSSDLCCGRSGPNSTQHFPVDEIHYI